MLKRLVFSGDKVSKIEKILNNYHLIKDIDNKNHNSKFATYYFGEGFIHVHYGILSGGKTEVQLYFLDDDKDLIKGLKSLKKLSN
ncbi:MAG: hypothetical protein AABW45_00100 [Nanoarchaeota archaeon]